MTINLVWPPPDFIRCTACGFAGPVALWGDPDPDHDGEYLCPKCPMDASGYEFFWDGDTLKSWWDQALAKAVDKAASQAHDDRMSTDDAPDALTTEAPPPLPDIKLTPFQRTAVVNSKEFNDHLNMVAEKTMTFLCGDNDDIEQSLEELCENLACELRLADPTDTSDEGFEKAMEIAARLEGDVHRLVLQRLGPMLLRKIQAASR